MRVDYAPLDARARGLGRHLLSRADLDRWAALPDVPALGRAWQAGGPAAPPLPESPAASDVDEAVRRASAAALTTFARWAGADNPPLQAFEAEQDRRSLRALIRGAAEGAPAARRLAGLLPTHQLTPARLADLARASSPRDAALRLLVHGDPHATALVALTASLRIDLLEVELVLARLLAQRWRDAARRGDAVLRATLRERIDLINGRAALELAGAAADVDVAAFFIAGGQALERDHFVAAATAGSRTAAATLLAASFAGTPLASLFEPPPDDPARLESAALARWIATSRRLGRVDPLGSAPAQLYLARLDAQGRDLRRLAWGLQLGLPPAELRDGLLTPWT